MSCLFSGTPAIFYSPQPRLRNFLFRKPPGSSVEKSASLFHRASHLVNLNTIPARFENTTIFKQGTGHWRIPRINCNPLQLIITITSGDLTLLSRGKSIFIHLSLLNFWPIAEHESTG